MAPDNTTGDCSHGGKSSVKWRGEKRRREKAMRLQVLLPKVDPKQIREPAACAYAGCGSKDVQMHQPVEKALRDTRYSHVEVHRSRCLTCGRTFRVYPTGVSQAQTSDRVKGLAVSCICWDSPMGPSRWPCRVWGCLCQKQRCTRPCRPPPDASPI